MQSPSLQITHSLWHPLYLRVWRHLVDAAQAVWLGLLSTPHTLAQRAERRAVWSGLSELSAHTLKDIGAPDWVMLDAADRSAAARRRLDELGGWRGV